MKFSILKEVKTREGRIAIIPQNAQKLIQEGHEVYVQKNAGVLSGFSDQDFINVGAKILETTKELIDVADVVLKVKEPTIEEVDMMRAGQMFFGYLHLAAIPETLQKILDKKIIALGFETVQMGNGDLPLLAPMSEIAGKLATQNGANFLRFDQGGRGILMGGTATVPPAQVVVIGGGVVGRNAASIAVGMGAKTIILEASPQRMEVLKQVYGNTAEVLHSDKESLEALLPNTDLLVGSVLIAGEKAPKLVSEAMVKTMKKGSVIVDVSVDQGGCVETSEVTTHENPVVEKHGVLHYGVANMPGSVPVTATWALSNASFPYVQRLANLGLEEVCKQYPEMQKAINCQNGEIVHEALKNIL